MSPTPDDLIPILSRDAPAPGGHYSQAIVHGGVVYVSGQLPTVIGSPHDPAAPFDTQLRRVLANLTAILAAAGSGPDRILKVSAYIVGGENWPAFNRIYAEVLGGARPARSVVPVPELHYGYLVEIDAIAAQYPE
ncbi:RidA family protein [Aquabacter sp. CN5-332]|uniref:RidA family protein n=1 Tax=Aquabacter sp. CN5-332 TaxID=3156608 RepID=UPI0032B4A83A